MKILLRSIRSLACTGLLSWTCVFAAAPQDLSFDEAWVRATPPGMKMTAGFGQLRNAGSEAIELVSFSSPEFADVTLHRTELVDGVSRMREVPVLRIPAGETIVLAPGGYHLMLMMPQVAVSEEQAISVEMNTADGRVFRFAVPVKRR
jgi:copper(I)-binding protein